jgi:uncharacterized protein (TIGR02466 family)
MIYQLFPVSIYLDKNISLISNGLNLFNNWKNEDKLYPQEHFTTSLANYDPTGIETTIDVLKTADGKVLVDYITQSVYAFLKENKQSTSCEVEVVNMWLNEMRSDSVHLKHNHFGYTFSGCFYVETPEPSNKIEFYSLVDDIGLQKVLKVDEWTPANASNWWIPVEPGMICIFPAFLKHAVPQSQFEGTRKSIAFDINLKLKR